MNESAEQWKKRTKKLTEEEAIEYAKEDLYVHWSGCPPLIGGHRTDDEIKLYPLSPEFTSKAWAISFIDPLSIRGEKYIEAMKDWEQKYGSHGISTLLILSSPFKFTEDSGWVEKFRQRFGIDFPAAKDLDGLICESLDVREFPTTVFFSEGKEIFRHGGVDHVDEIERFFHDHLRDNDPGLPLEPVNSTHEELNVSTVDWGFGPDDGFELRIQKAEAKPKELEPGEIFFIGDWMQENDYIYTKDNKAMVYIQSPRACVSVIAKPTLISAEKSRMVVTINDKPVYSKNAGRQLFVDDSGRSYTHVLGGELYHIIKDLPSDERTISLAFPGASRLPIGLYGIRFHD